MTTLSNLNSVVQHGDSAREAQNIRNQAVESSQQTAVQQEEQAEKEKTGAVANNRCSSKHQVQ